MCEHFSKGCGRRPALRGSPPWQRRGRGGSINRIVWRSDRTTPFPSFAKEGRLLRLRLHNSARSLTQIADDFLDISNVRGLCELDETDFQMKARLRRPTQIVFEPKQQIESSDEILFGKPLAAPGHRYLFGLSAED